MEDTEKKEEKIELRRRGRQRQGERMSLDGIIQTQQTAVSET